MRVRPPLGGDSHTLAQASIEDARRIILAAGMDFGGVEYLVDAHTGQATFYEINALSNFVANAPEVVGFDPFVQLVDLIVARAALQAGATVPA